MRERIRPLPNKGIFWLSSLLLCQSNIHGFVPPHPGSDLAENWEPIHAMRRRLQQPYNYTPSFVHPELCRYMSEEECQDVDESLQDHSQRHRRSWEQKEGDDEPEFADHIDESDFSSLLNHLDYPETIEPESRSSSSKQQQNKDTQPLLRRNPSIVDEDEPIIEVLILLMRFQDHKDRDLPNKSEYAKLWNERIHHWFDLNSYGNYRYRATVTDWIDTDDTEETYAAGVSGLRYGLQESIWPLLNTLNEDPTWDWSKFDQDNDGRLDAVVVLHSGYPAEVGGRDCTNQRPAQHRIWSHAFASSRTWTTLGIIGSEDYGYNLEQYQQLQMQLLQEMEATQQQEFSQQRPENGPHGLAPPEQNVEPPELLDPIYSLHGYLIASGLDSTCGAEVAKMGVMVHEYMHTLGLDDVYDYGTGSNGKGIGVYDIMGYPYGPANDEDYPGHLSAYSKISLGWVTPVEWSPAQGSQIFSMTPAETSDHTIKIFLTSSSGNGTTVYDGQPEALLTENSRLMPQYQSKSGYYEEYLLLEFRQALEYDRDLQDRTGLIIYHVDESVPRMNNRGYPGQAGWPENGNHYRVAVLGADSLFHLERGVNKGDSGDSWPPGSVLGPGTDGDGKRKRKGGFGTPNVNYPNTDRYQGGRIQETGIYVEVLSETNHTVTVRLSSSDIVSKPPNEENAVTARAGPDCINLFEWVDLEVTDDVGESVIESMFCEDVGKDPDAYCVLRDVTCGWDVWEICRKECPESDCHG